MRKTTWISRFVAGCAMVLAAGGATSALAADAVTVQLDWVVRGNHAMFFVGRDQGYFAKQGIDLTAVRKGTGSTDALRLVANGNATFGFGDLPTLIVGRTQGLNNTAIVAVNQKSPLAMISIKAKKPLNKPEDLKGLNIGVHPSGSTYVFLKAFFAKNGLSFDDVKQSTVAPPYENYLVLGRVDAVPGYIDAEVPELESKTGGPGTLSILQGSDFGLPSFGSGLFTADKIIADKPDLVQRFVRAYLQSFQFVIEHPQEAVDILVKANPEYKGKEDLLRKQLQADIEHTFFSAESRQHGIGSISPDQWAQTIKMFQEQGALSKDADPKHGFDNRFVAQSNPLLR